MRKAHKAQILATLLLPQLVIVIRVARSLYLVNHGEMIWVMLLQTILTRVATMVRIQIGHPNSREEVE